MRGALIVLLGMLAASGIATAANTEVRVGQDDANAGVAYLRYFPPTILVEEGDTVTWRANSHTPHTVTSFPEGAAGGFESSPGVDHNSEEFRAWFGPGGFLLPGQRFERAFNQTGTFPYFCKIHPGMEGAISVVEPGAGPGGLGSLGGNASGPRIIHIDVGGGSGETSIDRFFPANHTVAVGATVVWTNRHSSEPHTVTGAPANPDAPPGPSNPFAFDSSPALMGPPGPNFTGPQGVVALQEGQQVFTHTFPAAGTFPYFCKLHPPMWGTVIVLPKANATGSTSGGGAGTGGDGDARNPTPGPELALVLAGLALAGWARRRT